MFLTDSNNKEADKNPSALHDSSLLTDGPFGLPKSHKPWPDVSKHRNLVSV